MAPRALAKASRGLGGCGCGGGPAGVAAGLGLVLGREVMPCTTLAYAPRFAASGLKPPKSISADRVGIQIQGFPAYSTPPPQAQPLPTVGDESPVGGPPLFPLGGEDVGLRQLEHPHRHFFFEEGGLPPSLPRPRQPALPPPPPVDHP